MNSKQKYKGKDLKFYEFSKIKTAQSLLGDVMRLFNATLQ